MLKVKNEEHLLLLLGFLLILAYISPYIIQGENSFIPISDNLDSIFSYYKILADSGTAFSSGDTPVFQIFNGLPRVGLPTERSLFYFLSATMSPIGSYIFMQFIMRLVAFWGMYRLLRDFYLEVPLLVVFGTSLAFSFLPYWPMSHLSVAGLPMLMWALLRIRDGNIGILEWGILTVMPLSASFWGSLFFVLVLVGFWVLILLWQRPVFGGRLLCAMAYMSIIVFFVEYRMFMTVFKSEFVPHRVEMVMPSVPFREVPDLIRKLVKSGHYHAPSIPKVPNLAWGIATLVLIINRKWNRKFFGISGVLICLVACYGVGQWDGLIHLKQRYSILNGFNITRFFWLTPLFVYLLFAVSLSILWARRWPRLLAGLILLWQVGTLVRYHEQYRVPREEAIRFSAFYSEKLFEDISTFIGLPKESYRVVSLGMEPIVATWNGFYTLDFYSYFYPLKYKHEFAEVVSPELNKSEFLRSYYLNWGSRVYLYSSEIGHNLRSFKGLSISTIDLNYQKLFQMGARFLFSAVRIDAPPKALRFRKTFSDSRSPYTIDLYEIVSQ